MVLRVEGTLKITLPLPLQGAGRQESLKAATAADQAIIPRENGCEVSMVSWRTGYQELSIAARVSFNPYRRSNIIGVIEEKKIRAWDKGKVLEFLLGPQIHTRYVASHADLPTTNLLKSLDSWKLKPMRHHPSASAC